MLSQFLSLKSLKPAFSGIRVDFIVSYETRFYNLAAERS